MKAYSWAGFLSSSLTAISMTMLTSAFSSAEAASLSFNQDNLKLFGSTPVNFDVKLDDLGDGKVQVKVDVTNGYFADLRGLFFNISDKSLLSKLSVDLNSQITAFSNVGNLSSVGSKNNTMKGDGNNQTFDFGVEIGSEGIGKDDIRSASFIVTDSNKTLNVNSFSGFGIRLMAVGENREGSSKFSASSLPPVVIASQPPKEEPKPNEPEVVIKPTEPVVPPVVISTQDPKPPAQPTEIPEPGTVAAMAFMTVGGFKFLKRK